MTHAPRLLTLFALTAIVSACGAPPDRVEITDSVTKSEHSYQEKIGASDDERFLSREQFAAKQAAEAAPGDAEAPEPTTATPTTAPETPEAPASPFHFSVPDGWTLLPPTQFRNPNFAVGTGGDVECYVTVLPGGGGGIAGNINRWRGQFGVDEYSEDEIAELPEVEIMGIPGKVVNFSGDFMPRGAAQALPDYRLIGAVLQNAEQLVTIKLTGPETKIMQQLNNFAAFVDSLHPNDGHTHDDDPHAAAPTGQSSAGPIPQGAQMPADHPAIPGQPGSGQTTPATPDGPAPTSGGNYTWEVPDGWGPSAVTSSMRLVTFTVTDPQASGEAECYITVLKGDGGGRLLNYNRWLGQFNQDPLEESELILQPPVYLLGEEVPMLVCEGTYTGMRGTPKDNQMLLGASAMINGETLFVKLVGPKEVVRGNWARFARFCDSIQVNNE